MSAPMQRPPAPMPPRVSTSPAAARSMAEQQAKAAQERIERELSQADAELDHEDGITPAGLRQVLLLLEEVNPPQGGAFSNPATAAWLDVLRTKLRRAVRRGQRVEFVEAEVEAEAEPEAPTAPGA